MEKETSIQKIYINYRSMTDSEGHEFHYTQLPKHCLVCGKHCSSRESKYSVRAHTSDLLAVYGVLAERDDPAIHPPEFCHACYCKMKGTEVLTLDAVG